jgi:phage terminase large subunit GpA-like protein
MAVPARDANTERPYLRIYFACANQYVRVYRRPDQKHYLARCPTCGMTKTFRVGPSGTANRFFELTCR